MFIRHDPRLKQRSRELRKNMTPEEKHLWYDFLRPLRPRFLRQKPIGPYIVDFYSSACHLVIEVDGGQHYEPNVLEYDDARSAYLRGKGLTILRFTNTDVKTNFEGVCTQILAVIRQA